MNECPAFVPQSWCRTNGVLGVFPSRRVDTHVSVVECVLGTLSSPFLADVVRVKKRGLMERLRALQNAPSQGRFLVQDTQVVGVESRSSPFSIIGTDYRLPPLHLSVHYNSSTCELIVCPLFLCRCGDIPVSVPAAADRPLSSLFQLHSVDLLLPWNHASIRATAAAGGGTVGWFSFLGEWWFADE